MRKIINEKILKMSKPMIWSFNIYGSLFSLISEDENIKPWIFNNFIQIKYVIDQKTIYFDRYHSIYYDCPSFNFYKLPKECIEIKTNSFTNLCIDLINNNSYILITADRYHYMNYNKESKIHSLHELFIYGYNIDKKEFYCGDNIYNGKYGVFAITFNNLENAYFSMFDKWNIVPPPPSLTDIVFFSNLKKLEEPYFFNVDIIKKSLAEYLNSVETNSFSKQESCIYGINAIKQHIIDIEYDFLNNEHINIDIKVPHLLYERMVIMVNRLKYMKETNLFDICDNTIKKYEYLEHQYLITRNIGIKYNISNDNSIYNKYLLKIHELISYEEDLLINILKNLK